MPALCRLSLVALAFSPGCHPAIMGAVGASAGGGGGGSEDVVVVAITEVDKAWAAPASSVSVTVTLNGPSGRSRMLDFYLDPDGIGSPELAIKLTPSPLAQDAGSTMTHTIVVPAGIGFDSYRVVVEASNGKATATAQAECPLYVHPAGSQPATPQWNGTRLSTGNVECTGLARLSNGDVVMAGNWSGTVSTPLQQVSTQQAMSFYVARLRAADGIVIAETFAMPESGARATTGGVAVLPDDSCVLVGELLGRVDFGVDQVTNAPHIVDVQRTTAFVAHYAFSGGQGMRVRNLVVFDSVVASRGRAIAALPGSAEVVVVGSFTELTHFGAVDRSARGDSDGFVVRLGTDLSVTWAAQIGSPIRDAEECLAVSTNRVDGQSIEIAVAGYVRGTVDVRNGDGSTSGQLMTDNDSRDAFAATYNADGTLQWARRWGGPDSDEGRAVVISNNSGGVVFLGGSFAGTVNYTDRNNVRGQLTSLRPAGPNGFLVQYDGGGELGWVSGLLSDGSATVRAVAFVPDSVEELLVAGDFSNTLVAGLQPGAVLGRIRSMGNADAFLANLNTFPGDGGRGQVRRVRGFGGANADAATALLAPERTSYFLGAVLKSASVVCQPLATFTLGSANQTGCAVVRLAHPN